MRLGKKAVSKILASIIIVIVVVGLISTYYLYSQSRAPPTAMTATATATATTKAPVVLTAGWVWIIDTLDPASEYTTDAETLGFAVYDNLVTFQPNNITNFVPDLAQSWEGSADGRIWTFHLRRGVTFASGCPFNASAVMYTFDRVFKINTGLATLVTAITTQDGVKMLDDYTIQITLEHPGVNILAALSLAAMIVDPCIVRQHEGSDFGQSWLLDHAAGSGPFILQSYTRDVQMVLVKNPNYWRGPPKIDKMVWKNIVDPSDRSLEIQRGDIDVTYGLLPEQIKTLSAVPGLKVLREPSGLTPYLAMNLRYKPLSDPRVRLAIRYAIDYDGLLQLAGGYARRLNGPVPFGMFGYDPDLKIEQNLTKARELMTDAGYSNGFDLTLIYPFDVWLISTDTIATKLQSDLAQIGIKMSVQGWPWATFLEKYRSWRTGDMNNGNIAMSNWNEDFPDALADQIAAWFGPTSIGQGYVGVRTGYNNTEITSAFEQAWDEADASIRLQLIWKIQKINFEDGPFITLYQCDSLAVVAQNVDGFFPSFNFSPNYYNVTITQT
jgi:peptide/nickel transport system substrate-binding protein